MSSCSKKEVIDDIHKLLCLLSNNEEVYKRALQMTSALLCGKHSSKSPRSYRGLSRLVKSHGGNKGTIVLMTLMLMLLCIRYTVSLVYAPPSAFKYEDMKSAIDLNKTRLMLEVLDNSDAGQCTWLSRLATSVETAHTLGERIHALDRRNIKDEILMKPPNKRKLHKPLTTPIDSYASMKELEVSYPNPWKDVQPLIDAQARTLYYPEGKKHDETNILLHTLGVILPNARHAFVGLSRMNGSKIEYGVMDSGVDFDIKNDLGELEPGMTMKYKKWLYVTRGLFDESDMPDNCTVTENPVYAFLNDRFFDVAFAMDTSPIPYEGVIFHLEGNTTSATPYSTNLPIVIKSYKLLQNLKELHATTISAVNAYITEIEGDTCLHNKCSRKNGGIRKRAKTTRKLRN
jgi:hypothetical protein